MDNMIEIEGKTVDEAIEKACTTFGVPREKLSIDVLSEGTSGFLGLGSKKAKIRAGLLTLDIHEEIKISAREEIWDSPPPVPEKKPEPPPKPIKRVETPVQATPPPPTATPAPATTPVQAPEVTPVPPSPVATQPAAPVRKAPESKSDDNDQAVGLKAKVLLEGLLERMSIPSPVSLEETEDAIILNIHGDGEGLLIGKRGQNLDALQHIVNKAINKNTNGKKMIIVDTEAYRKRREESLVTLAEKLGQKVKKTHKTVTVSHMNAHDRRIIHMTLQSDAALLTKSRGEGEYRKIIIMPAKRERESGHNRHKAAAD